MVINYWKSKTEQVACLENKSRKEKEKDRKMQQSIDMLKSVDTLTPNLNSRYSLINNHPKTFSLCLDAIDDVDEEGGKSFSLSFQ